MNREEPVDFLPFEQDYHIASADGPSRSCDSSGTRYVTLVAGGIKTEGDNFPLFATSKASVYQLYFESLAKYLNGRRIIIWREHPTLFVSDFKAPAIHDGSLQLYQIYSRLTAY